MCLSEPWEGRNCCLWLHNIQSRYRQTNIQIDIRSFNPVHNKFKVGKSSNGNDKKNVKKYKMGKIRRTLQKYKWER